MSIYGEDPRELRIPLSPQRGQRRFHNCWELIPQTCLAKSKLDLLHLWVYWYTFCFRLPAQGSSALVQTTGYLLRAFSAKGNRLLPCSLPGCGKGGRRPLWGVRGARIHPRQKSSLKALANRNWFNVETCSRKIQFCKGDTPLNLRFSWILSGRPEFSA